jgi:hypothetical protein
MSSKIFKRSIKLGADRTLLQKNGLIPGVIFGFDRRAIEVRVIDERNALNQTLLIVFYSFCP